MTFVPGLDVVQGTALFGLGIAALVWVVRFAIRRRRARRETVGVSGARPVGSGDRATGVAASTGSAPADVAVTLSLPGDRPPRPVRHVELYAVELGLVAGALVVWLASLASVDPLVAGLLGSTLGAVGFWRVRSMAVATVRQEPRLWLVASVVGGVVGWLLFV